MHLIESHYRLSVVHFTPTPILQSNTFPEVHSARYFEVLQSQTLCSKFLRAQYSIVVGCAYSSRVVRRISLHLRSTVAQSLHTHMQRRFTLLFNLILQDVRWENVAKASLCSRLWWNQIQLSWFGSSLKEFDVDVALAKNDCTTALMLCTEKGEHWHAPSSGRQLQRENGGVCISIHVWMCQWLGRRQWHRYFTTRE